MFVVADSQNVELTDKEKKVTKVDVTESYRQQLRKQKEIYFRIDANFLPGKDVADFYYSTDGKDWVKVLEGYKMIFDYRRFFMGSKFAIFNYATKKTGGYVDIDWFNYSKSEK